MPKRKRTTGSRAAANAARNARTALAAGRTMRQAGEMAQAAGETIVHRTQLMHRAAGDPVGLGNPEFALMYREKGEAGLAAAGAMAAGMVEGQRIAAAWLGEQARLNAGALLSFARCRSFAEWLAVQRRYLEASAEHTATAGSRLAKLAGHAAQAGLAPIHRAAGDNAKRLARRGAQG